MSSLQNSESPQIKLINEWTRGFVERDLDLIAKALHKDFRRITYPRSIGKPEETGKEWLESFGGFLPFCTEVEMITHSIIETPGKVVVHATNNVKNSLGLNLDRESIYIVHIVADDDGSLKIKKVEEFTDSKAYLDTMQAFAAIKGKK